MQKGASNVAAATQEMQRSRALFGTTLTAAETRLCFKKHHVGRPSWLLMKTTVAATTGVITSAAVAADGNNNNQEKIAYL